MEIATCWNLVSLSSCCEQAAAGMLRAFPVHFVPLQSNSTQLSVHHSRANTKNYMNEIWLFIWNRFFANYWQLRHFSEFNLKSVWSLDLYSNIVHVNQLCMGATCYSRFNHIWQFLKENHQNSTWKSLHVNHTREPHINLDSFIFQTQFLTKFFSKFHLKIPTRQSQHTLTVHGSHTLIQIPSHFTVSQRKWSKFHLKIPARESQHCLQ